VLFRARVDLDVISRGDDAMSSNRTRPSERIASREG
jgi:hypothetical protein